MQTSISAMCMPLRHVCRSCLPLAALPNTANFFIQFCIARAIFINMVRLVWPHAGAMMGAIFRSLLRLGVPRSLHAAAIMHMPPSARATTNYNAILQVRACQRRRRQYRCRG